MLLLTTRKLWLGVLPSLLYLLLHIPILTVLLMLTLTVSKSQRAPHPHISQDKLSLTTREYRKTGSTPWI
jgi:hypothetical protein